MWVGGILAPPPSLPLLFGASKRRGEAAAHETTSAKESQRGTDEDRGGGMEGLREGKKGRNQRKASSKRIKVKKGEWLAAYLSIYLPTSHTCVQIADAFEKTKRKSGPKLPLLPSFFYHF